MHRSKQRYCSSLCGDVLIEFARTEPAHRAAETGAWPFGQLPQHRKSRQSQRLAHAPCVWRFLPRLGPPMTSAKVCSLLP